ncbi:MAG: glycogen-binding domain-containing protein, partial [Gemmatimonadota bacterium]|nr:glycogen-binding domain-containing protein [Gemmatimonadota bacterium]
SLRGFLGKSEPDPLTLAEPGSGGGGILLGRRIYSSDDERAGGADGPYEIVSRGAGQARVRISMEAPASARSVALLGDFTLWDSMQMRRTGGRWVAELDVPEGTHHYGFLVDDEWYLPDDARDVVPDEWGRRSAILVIEGVS